MKVRVIKHPDGKVSVIYPTFKSKKPEETEEEWLARVFEKAVKGTALEGLLYYDIDDSELPAREDRDAWEFDEAERRVKVNTNKVKKIKEERKLRELIAKEKETLLEEQAIARLKKRGVIS